jgi:hypothetical protein
LIGFITAGNIFTSSLIYSVGPGQQYALNDDFWKTTGKVV